MRLNYRQRLGIGVSTALYLNLFSGCGIHRTSPPSPHEVVSQTRCNFESTKRDISAVIFYVECLNRRIKANIFDEILYERNSNFTIRTMPQNNYRLLGRQIKRTLVLGNRFFQSLEYDADAESMLVHEIRHQLDYFYGIGLMGLRIPQDVESSDLRSGFMSALWEVRGHYDQLKYLVDARRRGKNTSNHIICVVASNYTIYWYLLNNSVSNQTQRVIRDEHLKHFNDIVPIVEPHKTDPVSVTEVKLQVKDRQRKVTEFGCRWRQPYNIGEH